MADLSAGMQRKGVSLNNVPLFEQQVAANLSLVAGHKAGDIAHVESSPFLGFNKVYVDKPSAMTQPVLNHEVMHQIQRKAGNLKSVGDDPDYNYGDPAEIKSIGNLDSEKQAQIVQDYTGRLAAMRAAPITPSTLTEADQLNSAYARPIAQLANMARQGNTIDTTPAAPGPPPAALTGMIKPLPQIGGSTLFATLPQR
jgi:hypothetical protein